MKIYIIIICLVLFSNFLYAEKNHWENYFKIDTMSSFQGITKLNPLNILAIAEIEYWFKPVRQITKSTDGGLSWKIIYVDTIKTWFDCRRIAYPTKNFIIVSCDSNYFLKTTDGGVHWEQHQIVMDYYVNGLVHISLIDSLYGVMGSYRNIAYSDDGFKTYKILKLPGKIMISDIKLISPTILYVLSNEPSCSFFKYDIKSDIWTEYQNSFPVYYPKYDSPYYMFFFDSLNGFVVGMRLSGYGDTSFDMIHKTTDGGKTWVEVLNAFNEPKFGLFSVDFFDIENGIAVGQFGKIYWTHDSGNTWIQDSSDEIINASSSVLYVTMTGKNSAIIADLEGKLWRTPVITGISVEKNNMDIPIYPNPTDSYIYINLPSEFLTEKIKIYSVEGILVYQTSDILKMSDVSAKIDVSRFPAGVYYVKVGNRVCRFIKI